MRRQRREHDLAYACLLFCGLSVLAIDVLVAVLLQRIIPIVILLVPGWLVAMIVGNALSVRLWPHWPLIMLAGMSVLFIVEFLTESGPVAFYNAAPKARMAAMAAIACFMRPSLHEGDEL